MVFNKLVAMLLESQEQPVKCLENGAIKYKIRGNTLHRADGPAVTYPTGSEYWYINGRKHREDGPAVIRRVNGKIIEKHWYKNGELHREDGPASEYCVSGSKYWYIDGKEFTEEKFNERIFNKKLASREDAIFDNDFLDGL